MSTQPNNAAETAQLLAGRLEKLGVEYAIGGALALGFWGEPRGTLDVDVTLFVSPKKTAECVECLLSVGCDFMLAEARRSLAEDGFCRVELQGMRVDVFLPIVAFYQRARARRKAVKLGDQSVWIWDAESLAVFKMMFFRRKDMADVEQILRQQGKQFDREWVREELESMYGQRDPRLSGWDELSSEQ